MWSCIWSEIRTVYRKEYTYECILTLRRCVSHVLQSYRIGRFLYSNYPRISLSIDACYHSHGLWMLNGPTNPSKRIDSLQLRKSTGICGCSHYIYDLNHAHISQRIWNHFPHTLSTLSIRPSKRVKLYSCSYFYDWVSTRTLSSRSCMFSHRTLSSRCRSQMRFSTWKGNYWWSLGNPNLPEGTLPLLSKWSSSSVRAVLSCSLWNSQYTDCAHQVSTYTIDFRTIQRYHEVANCCPVHCQHR